MVLSKDHLIEGEIISKGTSITIKESNRNITFKGKWTPFEQDYISEAIRVMLEYLTPNEVNSIEIRKTPSRKMLGYVSLSANSINSLNIPFYIANKNPKFNIDKALAHELTHIKQILDGQMTISNDNKVVWSGIEFPENTTDGLDSEAYRNSPWEKEAYGRTEEIIAVWKNSDYYKGLAETIKHNLEVIGLSSFIDGIEDLNHSTLQDIEKNYLQ